jgi:hypothetical protein
VEKYLGLEILHTSVDEGSSFLIQKPLDNKLKSEQSDPEKLDQENQIWKLFFDGASSREGSRAGVVLISPMIK